MADISALRPVANRGYPNPPPWLQPRPAPLLRRSAIGRPCPHRPLALAPRRHPPGNRLRARTRMGHGDRYRSCLRLARNRNAVRGRPHALGSRALRHDRGHIGGVWRHECPFVFRACRRLDPLARYRAWYCHTRARLCPHACRCRVMEGGMITRLAFAAPDDSLTRNTPFRPVKRLPTRPRCTPPNFARVDPDISSGKLTITAAWREYAAHAPRPYARGVFSRLYRQWQAAVPADKAEEFAASETYWHGRAAPRSPILVLDDGASIRMKGGLLEVFNRGETRRFDPSPHHRKPRAIVFANWGGLITIQAARFCIEHGIAVIAAGWLG